MMEADRKVRAATELPLPPQPNLPAPPSAPVASGPEEAITEEELKILEHLRGLATAGLELSDQLQLQKDKLEAKCKENLQRELNHGHINRFKRTKAQVESARNRIKKMDAEWMKFAATMSKQIQYHSGMYQKARAELMELYNKRLAEHRKLREEVDAASRSLLDQKEEGSDMETDIQFGKDLEKAMEALQEQTHPILIEDDDEMIPDPAQGDQQTFGSQEVGEQHHFKPSPHISFRPSTSPSKVATSHLKVKPAPKSNGKDAWLKFQKSPCGMTFPHLQM